MPQFYFFNSVFRDSLINFWMFLSNLLFTLLVYVSKKQNTTEMFYSQNLFYILLVQHKFYFKACQYFVLLAKKSTKHYSINNYIMGVQALL